MIIGPPRAGDRNTVAGEGIFLSISQPLVASGPARRRLIRQAPLTIFGMRNWPVEFDHLRLRKGFLSFHLFLNFATFAFPNFLKTNFQVQWF